MLVDFRSSGLSDHIEADLCIVGAGPAGISLAREFVGLPIRVALLESGLFESDERSQKLKSGTVDSEYFALGALSEGRYRQFGGTTNLWVYRTEPGDGRRYARSLPPEPIDLESRKGMPQSGWPLSMEALCLFYRRAQVLWNGGLPNYEVGDWADGTAQPLKFADDSITTRMCQHGPADVFFLRYRDDLVMAQNVDLHIGCTALQLESNAGKRSLRQIRVARHDGSLFSIGARTFVLATGGIENAQLMLLSEPTKPGGLGNLYDNVGRYLTDHPEFRMGTITAASPDVIDAMRLYDLRWVGPFMVSGFLSLSSEIKMSERLLNMSAALVAQEAGFGTRAHYSIATIRSMLRDRPSLDVLRYASAIMSSPRDAISVLRARGRRYQEFHGGWSRRGARDQGFDVIEVWLATEQTPSRDNRLTLSADRDWLGRRQSKLQWDWAKSDRDNVDRSIGIMAAGFERARLGRFVRWAEPDGPKYPKFLGLHHPMGATRMHQDPKLGVVDENCLVHGIENLYVAGSSVFPTGHGYANPTLTILALTLRLADHIKAMFAASATRATERVAMSGEPS